jgi:hypothetical protein
MGGLGMPVEVLVDNNEKAFVGKMKKTWLILSSRTHQLCECEATQLQQRMKLC